MTVSQSLVVLLALAGEATADVRQNARELPDVKPKYLEPAVAAATELATEQVDAALLVSIMWGESRFVPNVRKGHVCGIMQVSPAHIGRPRSDCKVWDRDIWAAIAAGILEIEIMLKDRRVRGNIRKALLYRSCGNSAFDGTCKKFGWVNGVIKRAARLRVNEHTVTTK